MTETSPPAPSPAAPSHRGRNLAILVVVVAVVVVLVVLAVVPVAQSAVYSWGSTGGGTATSTFNDEHGETFPCASGAHGTLVFTSDGVDTDATVVAPGGASLWASSEGNWTTQFPIASCGVYQFYTNGTGVGTYQYTLTVRWSAPLI